jgi:putative oxidoreductase
MKNPLAPFSDSAYALLRIVSGFLFCCHGAQKLFGAFGGKVADQPLFLAAGWIELVCGALIALGLLAAPAAFLASGEMAVAYFKFHFPKGFSPLVNRGEVVVLFCFLFLYVAARGAGPFSLERLVKTKRGA